MQCVYCKHTKLYKLANGYLKCAFCKRKISPFKIKKIKQLIDAFSKNMTARDASKECNCSYTTAKTHYDRIRLLNTKYLEEQYNKHAEEIKEFDEYFYRVRGVDKDNFIYYLKEFEFKFNYSKKEQKDILIKIV